MFGPGHFHPVSSVRDISKCCEEVCEIRSPAQMAQGLPGTNRLAMERERET